MHFSTALIAFVALGLKVLASPANLATTSVNLSNGTATVVVEVEVGSTLERRAVNCKGSSLCTNAQWFKNECTAAYNLIENTVYTPGGAKSGVCSGNCGIFIQHFPGQTCPVGATGQDLRNSYSTIRAAGCQACGSDVNGACEITINYVTGC